MLRLWFSEDKEIKIGLVIMASGLGRRFGKNKLLEELGGKPLIKWILDATEGSFDKRVVVTRNEEVKILCDGLGIECIIHALPNRNDTVRLGLSALADEVDYCFFSPGDQPLISVASITKLTETAKTHPDKIVRPRWGGTDGAPVGFPKRFFEALQSLPEGKGGNLIAQKDPESVLAIEIPDACELWDIDTAEDLEKIKAVLAAMSS